MTVAAMTGAGSGLGRALALAFGRRGGNVAVSDVDVEGAEETLKRVRRAGGDGFVTEVDTTDTEVMEAWCAEVFETYGRCDVLVNNAGIAGAGPVGETPLSVWQRTVDVNLMGPVNGCHFFVPRMKTQGRGGHIVNVASIAAFAAVPGMGAYNISKAGVVALSDTLRAELCGDGIGVTVVCPSFFQSSIHTTVPEGTPDKVRRMAERMVTESKWTADDIAREVVAAVDNNLPYVVPQPDAKVMWWVRRFAPTRATSFMRAMANVSELDGRTLLRALASAATNKSG